MVLHVLESNGSLKLDATASADRGCLRSLRICEPTPSSEFRQCATVHNRDAPILGLYATKNIF
eukprot:1185435-Prorocentrum_minimum.AAC.2